MALLLLLTDLTPEIERLRSAVAAGRAHPKQAKVDLAKRITADFHGAQEAAERPEEFDRRFAKKDVTRSDLEEMRVRRSPRGSIR